MDNIEFITENNEFKIRLSKTKKYFNFSPFSNYNCKIEFIDSLNNVVLSMNSTEKEILKAIESLYSMINNFGNILSDKIYFGYSDDCSEYFLYISIANIYSEGPLEDDDKFQLMFYHSSQQGNALKVFFECSLLYLDNFIYNLYLLLEDIPYLNEMVASSFLEFIGEEDNQEDDYMKSYTFQQNIIINKE